MCVFVRLAVITVVLAFAAEASAVVIVVPVTPAFLKKHPKAFSIKAKKRDDGRISFTIIRNLSGPRYLVSHLRVRKGSTLVVESHFLSLARKGTATYHFTLAPDHVVNSDLQISEGVVAGTDKNPVPKPGGIHYKIQLRDFAPQGANKSRK